MRYEEESRELIRAAGQKARDLGHSYVGSTHLLLALAAQQSQTGFLLRSAGVDPVLAEELVAVLYGKGAALPLPQGMTPAVRGILRDAAREAKHCRKGAVSPIHILLALTRHSVVFDSSKSHGL